MITNNHSIGLSVALLLQNSDYDYDDRENCITASSILKPLRALALASIHKGKVINDIDVTQLVASVTGSAVHTALENVWLNPGKVKAGLERLGFSNAKVLVNPTEEEVRNCPNHSIIYVEKRSEKSITVDGYTFILTGKFDIVLEGRLEDLKNTGTFKVIKALKEEEQFLRLTNKLKKASVTESVSLLEDIRDQCPTTFDYCMQGSIYRLLNPRLIVEEFMAIQFIMKDWYKAKVKEPFYPSINPYQFDIPLFSMDHTEAWVTDRMVKLRQILGTGYVPLCTDSELWRSEPIFKVYKDTKSKRALPKGTFTNLADAESFNNIRAKPGDIRLIASVPKRCNYCNVRQVCDQYDQFIRTGLLKEEK